MLTQLPAAADPAYSLARGFTFEGCQLRVELDGQPLWNAADVARALGYKDTNGVTRLLDDDAEGTHWVRRETSTPGGMQMAIWLTMSGVWEVLALSRRPEAKRLRRFMTTEVMPAIMTAGSYVHPEAAAVGVRVVGAPDTTPVTIAAPANRGLDLAEHGSVRQLLALAIAEIDAATAEARRQSDARALAEAKMAAQHEVIQVTSTALAMAAPKADAWDTLVAEGDDYSVDDAAKILARNHGIKTGRNRLHAWLLVREMVYEAHDQLGRKVKRPYQRHVELGRLRLRIGKGYEHPATGERMPGKAELRITAKGIAYIAHRMQAESTTIGAAS